MTPSSAKISEPFFSIIVNCRNSEKFLRDSLSTIQNQTFSDFEVIVWDNMSNDDTEKIVIEYEESDHRFQLHSGRESLNLGEARNSAVKESSGRYLAFLDSDDLWDPHFLHQHHLALTKFNTNSFGIGNVFEISEDFDISMMNEFVPKVFDLTPPKSMFRQLLKGNCVYFSTLVIPRDFFLDEAGFRNDFVQAEDYEVILRLAKKMSCYKTGLAYYRIHPGNATNSQEESLYRETIEILKPYIKLIRARRNQLGVIGKYYQFLSPLKSTERNERISQSGVSIFEIRLARAYYRLFEYLKAFIRNGKQ